MELLSARVTDVTWAEDIGMVEAKVVFRVQDTLRPAPYLLRVPAFAPADLRTAGAARDAYLIDDALRRNGATMPVRRPPARGQIDGGADRRPGTWPEAVPFARRPAAPAAPAAPVAPDPRGTRRRIRAS